MSPFDEEPEESSVVNRPKRAMPLLPVLLSVFVMLIVPAVVLASHEYKAPETVDSPSVGLHAAISYGPTGPAISYWDSLNNALKYAEWSNATSSWTIQTLDSPDVGTSTSIVFDDTGDVHISYYDSANGDLKYIKRTGGTWGAPQVVDSAGDTGQNTSITVDVAGNPHISYSSAGGLLYAKWTGASWAVETIDAGAQVDHRTTIRLDSNGYPHILYYDRSTVPDGTLKYVYWTGSDWTSPTAVETGLLGYPSLALDTADAAHVSFYDYNGQDLKYRKKTGGGWSPVEVIDTTGDVGASSSIQVNATGEPRISYLDRTLVPAPVNALKYAAKDLLLGWVLNYVDFNVSAGENTSLALDATNDAHIAYYDSINQALRYIKLGKGADVQAPYILVLKINDDGDDTVVRYTNDPNVDLSVICVDNIAAGCRNMRFSSDDVTYTAWQPYTPAIQPWTLDSPDGLKTIWVEVDDAQDNATKDSHSIYLDTTPPNAFDNTSPVSGDWVTATPTLSWQTAADSGSGTSQYDLWIDGSFNKTVLAPSTSTVPASLSESTHTWTVIARDNAGNTRNMTSTPAFQVDASAPTPISLTIDGGVSSDPQLANSTSVTLDTGCADARSGCAQMQFKNSDGTWSSWMTFDATAAWTLSTPDGIKTVYAKYKDRAGNTSSQVQDQITLDTSAPQSGVTIEAGAAWTNSLLVDLAVTCSDAISGCQEMAFSNDGLTWSSWETYQPTRSGWDLSAGVVPFVDGPGHRVWAIFRDKVGNVSPAVSDDIGVDREDPEPFTLVGPPDDSWTKEQWPSPIFEWNAATDLTSGIVRYELWVAPVGTTPDTPANGNVSKDATTASTYWDYRIQLDDGNYRWWVRAYDEAGNTQDSAVVWTVGYDVTPPTGSVLVSGGSPYTQVLDVSLDVDCSDTGSGCADELQLSTDGSWVTADASGGYPVQLDYTFPATQDSLVLISTVLSDRAGNTADVSSFIHLDRNPPTAGVVSTPTYSSDSTSSKSWWIKGWNTGAVDPPYGSGIQNYDVWWRYKSSSSWKTLKSGTIASSLKFTAPYTGMTYCFKARARDLAGNVGPFSSERCTVVPFDNSYSKIWYSSGWTKQWGAKGPWLGSLGYANKKGVASSLKFAGRRIIWLATKGPKSGYAKVFVNGVLVKTVDLYSPAWKHRQKVFDKAWSTAGVRSIKIVVQGKKRAVSKGTRVDIDGFLVVT